MNWSQCRIALGYNCLMMNIIQQAPIQCLRIYLILFLLSYYYCYYYRYCYKISAITITVTIVATTIIKTIYLIQHSQIQIFGMLQLLILENILWLPLCRINKFGLNTLPSKTVAIPYTCGLSLVLEQVNDKTRIFDVECCLTCSSHILFFIAWTFGILYGSKQQSSFDMRLRYSSISTSNHVFQTINAKISYPQPIMLNH